MKLVTFQSMDSLKYLINNGYLICNDKYIDKKKAGFIYDWVLEKMNNEIKNETASTYPIWAWVKCYNGICPPKHKGNKINGFDVKITFNKKSEDIFITDFIRFSFLLNNIYIPDSLNDYNKFEKIIKEKDISKEELKAYVRRDKYDSYRNDKDFIEICAIIRKSFDKCITKDSDILQGCVWSINLEEVENIEILPDDGYTYGSLNYKRKNGKRIDWQTDFYKKLK